MFHVAVVVTIAAALSLPASGRPQGNEAEKARADALKALKTGEDRPFSQDLERSKQKWPAYDREIEAGILEQEKALEQGGSAADDLLIILQNRAKMQETPPALYLYGRFLGVLDQLDQATQKFEAALRLDPYFPWAHHGLGTSLAKRGKFAEAVRAYRRALELNPGFIRSMQPLAACLSQVEQYDEAERVVRKLIEIQPKDPEGHRTVAKLLSQRTRYAESAAEFATVLKLKPGDEEARRLLAYNLRKAGKHDDATKIYSEILKDSPSDFWAHMGLAQEYDTIGENHLAADEYQKALDNWPSTSPLQRKDIMGRIDELRRLPAVEKRDPRTKSPHEWVEILLNSTEPERCLEAIRVLSSYPYFDEEVYKSFLKALKNKSAPVRVLAIKELAKRYEGLLKELTPLLSLFVVDDPDRLVRGIAARVLGLAEDPAAVPALMKALKDRDPYVFREVHDALWRLTSSEMTALLPKELTPEVMESLAQGWQKWYDENRDRYKKFETAPR